MSQRSDSPGSGEGSASADDLSQGSDERIGTTRRRLLATGAAAWATVLAGCPGDGGDGDDGGATATETPTETSTQTQTPNEPQNYVVTTETAAGGEGVPGAISFISACAATNTFVPGMQAVFYVGIYDPQTGDRLTPDDLGGVQVNVGDGMDTVELSWSDEYSYNTAADGEDWVGSWMIPDDMEPGELSYSVEVSGSEAEFQDVGILTDSIEVVEYDDPTNYVVDATTQWNGHPAPDYTNGFVGACAPEREFTPELDVTFVVGIYDSTSGNMVGSDGLYNPNTGQPVEDEGSEVSGGLDSVTVVSTDGSFDDVSLSWNANVDDENSLPQWNGVLETENLDPGTYAYEVQVSNESKGRFNTGIAASQFSIIEVPSN